MTELRSAQHDTALRTEVVPNRVEKKSLQAYVDLPGAYLFLAVDVKY